MTEAASTGDEVMVKTRRPSPRRARPSARFLTPLSPPPPPLPVAQRPAVRDRPRAPSGAGPRGSGAGPTAHAGPVCGRGGGRRRRRWRRRGRRRRRRGRFPLAGKRHALAGRAGRGCFEDAGRTAASELRTLPSIGHAPPALATHAPPPPSPRPQRQFTLRCQRIKNLVAATPGPLCDAAISRAERCRMLLRILDLLCATTEVAAGPAGGGGVALRFDAVGHVLGRGGGPAAEGDGWRSPGGTGADADADADGTGVPAGRPGPGARFALPAPARDALLGAAERLLDDKDALRGAGNAALDDDDDDDDDDDHAGAGAPARDADGRVRLVLAHDALLRLLLRTGPHLDPRSADPPPAGSDRRRRDALRRTVRLVRALRGFLDQEDDRAARELWGRLGPALRDPRRSWAAYRALTLLYLCHPTRCSGGYYAAVVPDWLECWRGVDRNPEWDNLVRRPRRGRFGRGPATPRRRRAVVAPCVLTPAVSALPRSSPPVPPQWMVLFARARKHLPPGPATERLRAALRRHLLTSCGFWLQVPVGGTSPDRSFPRAGTPGKRSLPGRVKAFLGFEGRYEEGMSFLALLCKLLVFCAGPPALGDDDAADEVAVAAAAAAAGMPAAAAPAVSEGTADLLRFLACLAPYYNPSNIGQWTFPLGGLVYYLTYHLSSRVGVAAGWEVLRRDHSAVARRLLRVEPHLGTIALPGHEVVALLDGLLPLAQQVRGTPGARLDIGSFCVISCGERRPHALRAPSHLLRSLRRSTPSCPWSARRERWPCSTSPRSIRRGCPLPSSTSPSAPSTYPPSTSATRPRPPSRRCPASCSRRSAPSLPLSSRGCRTCCA